MFAGLSGVFIVDGLQDRLPPELRDVPERVMAIKDLQVKDGAIVRSNIDSNAPTTRTVNGQVNPILTAETNRTQLLRLANIGADIWYRLRLNGAQFHVIGEDANPVAEVWTADELVLPPGKRYDVLVRWPTPGNYALETLPYSTGPDGDNYPERRLATFEVTGDPLADVPWPTSLNSVSPLKTDRVDRTRNVVFSENPKTKPVLHQRQAVQRDQGHLRREAGDHRGVGDQEHRSRGTPLPHLSTTSRSWQSTASPTKPRRAGCRAAAVSRRGEDPYALQSLRRNHRVPLPHPRPRGQRHDGDHRHQPHRPSLRGHSQITGGDEQGDARAACDGWGRGLPYRTRCRPADNWALGRR